ncbi:MAG: hypothetical protein A2X12_05815 [Bacteroidetes bacterium GWE2_29_8]|nr:MAG: hypothetical protein A2X12_05815 [Bacteroidetes bacterium GWE2_29_8]OFY17629.1 MAG: hypothetical protein A2X02_07860 [Bacteroidetes bacterium GWF2_29_10]
MNKILITGIDGFLGLYLAKTSNLKNCEIVGTYFNYNESYKHFGFDTQFLDITDFSKVQDMLSSFNPNIIIHTAGLSNVDEAEKFPDKSYKTTVIGTWNIAQWCKKNNAKLMYCSSNAIFSGDDAPYNENAIPNPTNEYGKHKFMAESLVRFLEYHLIFRLILMYGWNYHTRHNPVTYVIESLSAGKKLNMVAGYSYINPLYVGACCDAIWNSISKEINKEIYHIAGAERVDRYELAIKTAKVFNLDQSLITPVDNDFFASLAHRPFDSTYINLKAEKELNFKPLSLEEGLNIMKKQM